MDSAPRSGSIPTDPAGVNSSTSGSDSKNPGGPGHVPVGVGPAGPATVTPSDPDGAAKPTKA